MYREEVLRLCYAARSRPSLLVAREARAAYLLEHADDDEILDLGSMLSRLEDAVDAVPSPTTASAAER